MLIVAETHEERVKAFWAVLAGYSGRFNVV
jgi:hypothetical protein